MKISTKLHKKCKGSYPFSSVIRKQGKWGFLYPLYPLALCNFLKKACVILYNVTATLI